MNQIVYKLVISEIEPKRGVAWFNPATGLTLVFYNDKWIPLGKGVDIKTILDKIEIPKSISSFINDAGYLTLHQSLADYYTKSLVEQSIEDAISEYNTALGNTGFIEDEPEEQIVRYTGTVTTQHIDEEDVVIWQMPDVSYSELVQNIGSNKLVYVKFVGSIYNTIFIGNKNAVNNYLVCISFINFPGSPEGVFGVLVLKIEEGSNDSVVLTEFVYDVTTEINGKANANDVYTKQETDTRIGNMFSDMIYDLPTVARTGNYSDLNGIPQYVVCTLAQYDAMQTHDSNTYYIIIQGNG